MRKTHWTEDRNTTDNESRFCSIPLLPNDYGQGSQDCDLSEGHWKEWRRGLLMNMGGG
jgi:hypothetical protein